jgi:ubiquitin carboxyl-terminal hydrolase 14
MTIVNVVVKWNAQKYPVAVDLDQPGIVFKTQLFSLTNVAPDRQKIMVKGGMLKDDGDMKSLNLKENQQLMMMGTIGELKEPVEKPKFMEDMTDAEISKAVDLIDIA